MKIDITQRYDARAAAEAARDDHALALEIAESRVDDTKRNISRCHVAGNRAEQVIRFFEDLERPHERAEKFATVLASSAQWSDYDLPDCEIRVRRAIRRHFPSVDAEQIAREAGPLTAAQAGELLGVTFEAYKRLKLFMLRPIDATDEELKAYRRDRRNERKRSYRPRSKEDRRAHDLAKSLAIQQFAGANGLSVGSVRNGISKGKLKVTISCENGGPSIIYYIGPATFTKKGSSVSDLAREHGVSKSTIKRWIASGKIGRPLKATAQRQPAAPGPVAGLPGSLSVALMGHSARFPDIAASTRDAFATLEQAARCGPRVVDDLIYNVVLAFRRVA